jgi:hypothetical protein
MRYENIEPLGGTHILFRDDAGCRIVCPLPDLQCWEAGDHEHPTYKIGGCLVTKGTFDDVIAYLRERG